MSVERGKGSGDERLEAIEYRTQYAPCHLRAACNRRDYVARQ